EALLERVKMGISENTTTPYATDIEENNQNDKAIEEIIEEIDQRAEDMSSDRIRIVDYDDRITHANFREFERFQMFENYVQTLIEKNITVIFYCDPYHPIAYSKAQDEKEKEPTMLSLMDIEVYFKNFAQANGILIIGSYNPHVYNLTSIDFFNGDHTVSQTFAKIISAHSHELYDLLYTDIYSTYEEYASALAESQAELLG
ncbi:MAG: hypothetical protein LBV40_04280, partial [Methanomicrobiales archaeon]|nr:hypothetical protein [Methanomicrobiales archaeon]